ncbi:MAG: DUF2309 domain-containing protein [Gammaproteobacteria bacterium]|nr:DUF2309 domain-containing protein [Gammaproteobacteria bacterium]
MSLSVGQRLSIRSMIYVAGESIPFFWPMRNFIHHNPLHGFENLPFEQAVQEGRRLFHGRVFLRRPIYQRYIEQGRVDSDDLTAQVSAFVAERETIPALDLKQWLMALLTQIENKVVFKRSIASAADIQALVNGLPLPTEKEFTPDSLVQYLRHELLGDRPVYDAVDALYGTEIATELDELVIKSCLDFFDEGQSVWSMPGRRRGFFRAWREVAKRNIRFFLRGMPIQDILAVDDTPEGVIAHVMNTLGIPEDRWVHYFTRELAQLHGWTGFIRWRWNAKNYHWSRTYPADLIDLIAVRLTFALALLSERGHKDIATTAFALEEAIEGKTKESFLRYELFGKHIVPAMAKRVEQTLARGNASQIEKVFHKYIEFKRQHEAKVQADRLHTLAARVNQVESLRSLSADEFSNLQDSLRLFERGEGLIWLRAMEAHAIKELLAGVNLTPPKPRDKRPFVQAMFCIDTRSERIRRHLESVGDYQTYGIAGFFGVPVSFMGLGKGSEMHLCPVLLTPKNLVLEMTVADAEDVHPVTALEKALHELKESVFAPFVTVEAIGLLFGFDMVGKTLMPQTYNHWRKRLYRKKRSTHLLIDKLSREQADSVVRTVQRAVIIMAIEQDFRLEAEHISDGMVRELREAALTGHFAAPALASSLNLNKQQEREFILRLRDTYRIDAAYTQLQMERLGRIGFSLDEQVGFVGQALRSIGLTRSFSRFILLFGHGSSSENNPYESALDCGACGGNHGLVSARVLAQMANKKEVRRKLRAQGLHIADDAWFVAALHNTTTDELKLYDLDHIPSTHIFYIDRLRNGLLAASRLCAQERLPSLQLRPQTREPTVAYREVERNAMDWSQVRPEWGLSRNAYFIIGRRALTEHMSLEGRSFLHSYDYHLDPRQRLLENIITGPLVVAQWINMEHYFSTVDNERFGSSSKVYHNVAGRFGVMTGGLSDLRTGLPSQTVLDKGLPFHEPLRLITLIEAPLEHARRALESVVAVKNLVSNDWIRLLVIDPETRTVYTYNNGQWDARTLSDANEPSMAKESSAQ